MMIANVLQSFLVLSFIILNCVVCKPLQGMKAETIEHNLNATDEVLCSKTYFKKECGLQADSKTCTSFFHCIFVKNGYVGSTLPSNCKLVKKDVCHEITLGGMTKTICEKKVVKQCINISKW